MSTPNSAARIIEFSPHELSPSFSHFQIFSQSHSLGWEVELFPAYDENLLDGARGARVDFALSDQIFASISTFPSLVRDLECFDTFLSESGKWLPRVLLFEALRGIIVERIRDLDIRSCAYVIGDNEEARVVAGVMVNLGFSKIYVVSENEGKLKLMNTHLRRKFIGVEFREIPAAAMTMQMVQAGILVNCADLDADQNLLTDLSYFNFMKRNALVLDLTLAAEKSVLLEEATRAELRTIAGCELHLQRDLLFLQRCGLAGFPPEDYARSWLEFLKSHPSSSYKKRHS